MKVNDRRIGAFGFHPPLVAAAARLQTLSNWPEGRSQNPGLRTPNAEPKLRAGIHRDHRGLRAMILFWISGVALITPPKTALFDESCREERLARWSRSG